MSDQEIIRELRQRVAELEAANATYRRLCSPVDSTPEEDRFYAEAERGLR